MGMTLTEKILARHSDKTTVKPGDLIFANIDLVLSVDIGTAPTIEVLKKMGAAKVFDPQKIVLVNDHFVPAKDIDAANLAKQMKLFAREQKIPHFYEVGSSREVAAVAIKSAGISCIIAGSFARIFYRNAINIGLPIFECAEAVDNTEEGEELEVDPKAGIIRNLHRSESYTAAPFSPVIREIIDMGGLVNFVRKQFQEHKRK